MPRRSSTLLSTPILLTTALLSPSHSLAWFDLPLSYLPEGNTTLTSSSSQPTYQKNLELMPSPCRTPMATRLHPPSPPLQPPDSPQQEVEGMEQLHPHPPSPPRPPNGICPWLRIQLEPEDDLQPATGITCSFSNNQATSHVVCQPGSSTTDFDTDLCNLTLAASQAQLYLNQNEVPNPVNQPGCQSGHNQPPAPPVAIFLSGVLHDADPNPLHLESPSNGAHLRSQSLASAAASISPMMPP